jgi:hypothetical protein
MIEEMPHSSSDAEIVQGYYLKTPTRFNTMLPLRACHNIDSFLVHIVVLFWELMPVHVNHVAEAWFP